MCVCVVFDKGLGIFPSHRHTTHIHIHIYETHTHIYVYIYIYMYINPECMLTYIKMMYDTYTRQCFAYAKMRLYMCGGISVCGG